MGFSNIKAWLICFVLITMAVVNQVDAAPNIDPAVLDPCKRPGGPHPGCHPDINSAPEQANAYQRGCSKTHKCRSGDGNQ